MKRLRLFFTPIAIAALIAVGVSSCTKDRGIDGPDGGKPSNLTITVGGAPTAKGGGPARSEPLPTDVAAGLQLFAFSNETPPTFSHYLPVSNVTESVVKSNAPVGTWNLAMTYFRNPTPGELRVSPVTGVPMDKAMLYHYAPTVSGSGAARISSSALEVFRGEQRVEINTDANTTENAFIARNVAMVQLVISKSTLGIDKDATAGSHKVYLYGVPSTVSYGGKLLRHVSGGNYEVDTVNPDTLATPLEGRFQLSDHSEAGYLKSDVVSFIIPAHQGSDFWSRDAAGKITGINPASVDTTTRKMKVTLDLERPGGSRYTKTAEIPVVAPANKILRVSITVNAGVEIGTEVLDWNYVEVNENVGEEVSGAWIYVKKGSSGTGLSWSDALGSISEATLKIFNMRQAGITDIHGVLVAGGESREYDDFGFDRRWWGYNIRIYGGWEGTPGTELSENDTYTQEGFPSQPQTSAARKLATHKAIITVPVLIEGDILSYIDGLIIKGVGQASGPALKINQPLGSLVANAVEIIGNNTSDLINLNGADSPYSMTNILIADNAGTLGLFDLNLNMINATIVGNANVTLSGGVFTNTVVWGNTGTVNLTGAMFNFCASNVAGTSNTINANNTGILAPLFNLSSQPKYTITGANSPLSVGGDGSVWTTLTTNYGLTKDINGNPRISATSMVDIGAYQSSLAASYHPLAGTPVDWHNATTGDWGYVGTFHRATETSERLIVGPHSSGDWSAYVENGSDWISLDMSDVGANSGQVLPGNSVGALTPNATTASGAPGIRFRVGLRTELWGGATSNPRYGTIIVTWNDGTTRKQSRIYVRQGEGDDYLYSNRTGAVKFSPYNLSADSFESSLAINGGRFAQYPSQCGGYFQWMNQTNSRFAYAPSGVVGAWNNATPYYEAYWTENETGTANVLATNHETCPVGYRRVNDGATDGEPTGTSEMRQSLWADPAATTATNTYGGYYADGFFDAGTITSATHSVGTGNNMAYRGRLFYNPATNASLFFPAAGQRQSADGAIVDAGSKGYYWNSASTISTTVPSGSTAYVTTSARSSAVTIRCVKR